MGGIKRSYTACVFAAMFLLASVHAAMGTLLSDIIDTYALNDSGKGIPNSIVSGFSFAGFIVMMLLSGRVLKRSILKAALLIGGAALICAAADMPYAGFLCLMMLTGLSLGLIDAVNSPIVSELYPASGAAMCALHAVYGAAGFVMPFVFRLLNSSGNWRSVYLLIGVSEAALCAVTALVTRKNGAALENPVDPADRVNPVMLKSIFGEKRLIPVFVSITFGSMYLNGMLMWTPRFMELGKGSTDAALYVLACVYLGIAVSRLIMSALKVGTKKYLTVSLPLSVIALAAAVLIRNPYAAIVFVFLSQLFQGPAIPRTLSKAAQILPEQGSVVIMAMMLMMMLGQTVVSPLFALAETRLGSNAPMCMSAVLLALSWAGALCMPKD